MNRRGISCSAYFVDVSSAYYRVIRQLVVGMQTSDQEIIQILERFGLGPMEFSALREQLKTRPILSQYETCSRDEAMMQSLMEGTWFSVVGSEEITRTRTGSRPGDTMADLIFAFIYSHLLQTMRLALEDEGFVTQDSLEYSEAFKTFECQDIEMQHAPSLLDVTWADDLLLLQSNQDSRELLRRTALAGGLLSDLCSRRGLQLNYKAGKTECLLRLKGRGTKALRFEIFDKENPSLKLPSMIYEDLQVRLVANYKHLGNQITMASSQMHEIKVRTGQAKAIYNKHRRSVFQNACIAVKVRVKLLNVLVLSVLNYNQGTWRPLNSREWKYYQNVIMSMYRGLARATVPFDELQEWNNERVTAYLEVASPQDLLHASRLRYLGSMWRGAPNIVWWMHHMEKTWFRGVEEAVRWLEHNTGGLQDREAAAWRETNWTQLIPHPETWKYYIKKATAHAIATAKADELAKRWHFEFVERLIEKGLDVDHSELLVTGLYEDGLPSRHRFGCLKCKMTFANKASWSVHAFKKHARVAPEKHAIRGSICEPCNKEFFTTQRLLRHLRYSPQCAAIMMETNGIQDEVLPGCGNVNVDNDRIFPLPVKQLPGPHSDMQITNKSCRSEHSVAVYSSLMECILQTSLADVQTCVQKCLELISDSTDCSDEVMALSKS